MPVSSHFTTFDLVIIRADLTAEMVANQAVHVYDVTNGAALADLMSDANGVVAAGTLPVAAGTLVRFAWMRADLECGKAEQTTY